MAGFDKGQATKTLLQMQAEWAGVTDLDPTTFEPCDSCGRTLPDYERTASKTTEQTGCPGCMARLDERMSLARIEEEKREAVLPWIEKYQLGLITTLELLGHIILVVEQDGEQG